VKATTAKRPEPITAQARLVLVQSVLDALGLGDTVAADDVLSIHLAQRTVNVRRKVRGRTGKVLPGHSLSATHSVLPEPLED
jgi:hypothetical protein